MLIGNSGAFNLGMTVILRDQFTTASMGISKRLGELDKGTENFIRNLKDVRNNYGMLTSVGIGLSSALANLYGSAATFDTALRGVRVVTEATNAEFSQLRSQAQDISKSTIFTPNEIAKSMQIIGQAGFSAKETMATIQAATDLAQATLSDTKGSTETLISIINAFQIPKDDVQAITEAVDILGTASNRSATNMYEMAETFRYSQTTARALGLSLKDVAAFGMAVSNVGLRGSIGGTTIDNMLRYLTKAIGQYSTSKQRQALQVLNVAPQEFIDSTTGRLKSMVEIFALLKERTKDLDTITRQSSMMQLFGVRGFRGTLLVDNLLDYQRMIEEVNNPQSMSSLAKYMNEGPEATIKRMMNAWEITKQQFMYAVIPIADKLLNTMTLLADAFTRVMKTGFGRYLTGILTTFLLLKTSIWGVKAIFAGFLTMIGLRTTGVVSATMKIRDMWMEATAMLRAYNVQLIQAAATTSTMAATTTANAAANAANTGAARGNALSGLLMMLGLKARPTGNPAVWSQGSTLMTRNAKGQFVKYAGETGTRGVLGGYLSKAGFKKWGTSLAVSGANRAVMGSAARGLGGILGGPAGAAIFVATLILPLLSGIFDNTKSSAEELKSLNEDKAANDVINQVLNGMRMNAIPLANYGLNGAPEEILRRNQYLANPALYQDIPGKVGTFVDTSRPGIMNVYMGGSMLGTVEIEDRIASAFQKVAYDATRQMK